jgi:hypothetical protein
VYISATGIRKRVFVSDLFAMPLWLQSGFVRNPRVTVS